MAQQFLRTSSSIMQQPKPPSTHQQSDNEVGNGTTGACVRNRVAKGSTGYHEDTSSDNWRYTGSRALLRLLNKATVYRACVSHFSRRFDFLTETTQFVLTNSSDAAQFSGSFHHCSCRQKLTKFILISAEIAWIEGTLYLLFFLLVLTIFEGSTDLEHIQIIHKVGGKLRLNKRHSLSCLSHELTPWMSFLTKIIAMNSSKGIRGKCIWPSVEICRARVLANNTGHDASDLVSTCLQGARGTQCTLFNVNTNKREQNLAVNAGTYLILKICQ